MTLDSLDAILVRVAKEHGVRPMRIIDGGKCQAIQRIKREVMYEMREAGGSLPKIARVLGLRHHQPVIHGLRVYAVERAARNRDYREPDDLPEDNGARVSGMRFDHERMSP